MTSDNPFVTQKDYVDAVLDTYVSLPDTPNRTRRDDCYLAITWYRQGIMVFQAIAAMMLATERRTFREPDALPLEPIRSLRYFVPIVHWAHMAVLRDTHFKLHYQSLRAKGHRHARALRGVMDRILTMALAMLRDRTLYDPSRHKNETE